MNLMIYNVSDKVSEGLEVKMGGEVQILQELSMVYIQVI
jgi:hypothetical protein